MTNGKIQDPEVKEFMEDLDDLIEDGRMATLEAWADQKILPWLILSSIVIGLRIGRAMWRKGWFLP